MISVDEAHDLAILKFDGARLPALRLADDNSVREGELYAFTGYPQWNHLRHSRQPRAETAR